MGKTENILLKPLRDWLGTPEWAKEETRKMRVMSEWASVFENYSEGDLRSMYVNVRMRWKYTRWPEIADFIDVARELGLKHEDKNQASGPSQFGLWLAGMRRSGWPENQSSQYFRSDLELALNFMMRDFMQQHKTQDGSFADWGERMINAGVLSRTFNLADLQDKLDELYPQKATRNAS